MVQQEFQPGVLARVTSYDWLLSLAGAPLGYVLAPLAADTWGSRAPLLASAVLVTLVCAGTAAVPGVRRFGTRPPRPATAEAAPGEATKRPPART
ncbi:hypothetical protein ABZW03_31335 [Kitasatospora sp. NPDC004799]|uniref:hypothetical protein n=1 Tax=Kitasatospora sp. NPDC004799 TaxID=3154460 RepID=UPI00339EA6C0